jgi:hypothetical protein
MALYCQTNRIHSLLRKGQYMLHQLIHRHHIAQPGRLVDPFLCFQQCSSTQAHMVLCKQPSTSQLWRHTHQQGT